MTNESDTPRTDDAEADAVTGEPTGLVAAVTMRGMEAQLRAANERVELFRELWDLLVTTGNAWAEEGSNAYVIFEKCRAALTKGKQQ